MIASIDVAGRPSCCQEGFAALSESGGWESPGPNWVFAYSGQGYV